MEIDAHFFIFSVVAGVILVLMVYEIFNDFVRGAVREIVSEQIHDLLHANIHVVNNNKPSEKKPEPVEA